MVSIQERRSLRSRVLRGIYELADGTSALVSGAAVRESLGVADADMGAACEFLAGEGLVRLEADAFGTTATPSLIALTHQGVVRVEESAGA